MFTEALGRDRSEGGLSFERTCESAYRGEGYLHRRILEHAVSRHPREMIQVPYFNQRPLAKWVICYVSLWLLHAEEPQRHLQLGGAAAVCSGRMCKLTPIRGC